MARAERVLNKHGLSVVLALVFTASTLWTQYADREERTVLLTGIRKALTAQTAALTAQTAALGGLRDAQRNTTDAITATWPNVRVSARHLRALAPDAPAEVAP